jgi:hypothetical protein
MMPTLVPFYPVISEKIMKYEKLMDENKDAM